MPTITFTGDILPSTRINEITGGDFSGCFSKAYKLKSWDYLVGNLETPVAGEEMLYTYERFRFNSPTGILDALKNCGFDMLTLANNHCMDRGEQGIVKTLDNCQRYGFDTVGIYRTESERNTTFVKDFNGIRVAFVNYTYGINTFVHKQVVEHSYMVNLLQPEETTPGSIHLLNDYVKIAEDLKRIHIDKSPEYEYVRPHLERLEADIKKAKQSSDYVIAVIHNGGQYVREVDPYSIYMAEKIKQLGADIIIGHHQHLIQKSDFTDDYTKIYCLGNLFCDNRIVSEGCFFDEPLFNVVFHLTLDKDENGEIKAKQSFSIYTTMTDDRGIPVVVDSADVLKIKNETYLRMEILRYANLFAGEERYTQVQEIYEL